MKRVFMHKIASLSISCLLAFSAFAQVDNYTQQQITEDIKNQIKAERARSLSEIQQQQRDALSCGKDYMPLAELSSLAVNCWDMKKSKDEDPNVSEEELLKADRAVCDCLGESPHEAVKSKMKGVSIQAVPESGEALKNFNDNVALAQKRIQNLQNGVMFQASVLSESNQSFTQAYSQGDMKTAMNTVTQESLRKDAANKASNNFMSLHGQNRLSTWISPTLRNRQSNLADNLNASLKNIVVSSADASLLTNRNFAPKQCITAREFLGYKLLPPSTSTFYTALTNKEKFQSTDWNYPSLQNTLKSLHEGVAYPERQKQIQIIKDRMNFLNRNPMFKTFFMVNLETNKEYFEAANISGEEQNKIINNPGWTKLDKYKGELFDIIKNLDPNDAQSVSDFSKKSAEFFRNSEVGYLTNLEVKKAAVREISELSKPSSLMPAKLPITQKELEAKFAENTNFISPAECTKGGANVELCVNSYAAYCKLLNESQLQTEVGGQSSDKMADMTFENLDNFDTNIETNPEFKKFNEILCNSRRVTGKPGSSPKTFFEFKQEYCSKNPSQECRPDSIAGNSKIRALYLTEYKTLEVSSDKKSDQDTVAAFMAATQGQNTVKAFDEQSASTIAKTEATPDRAKNMLDQINELFGAGNQDAKVKNEEAVFVPETEGSAFSSFARGMDNLASSMGGVAGVAPVEDMAPMLGSSSITPTAAAVTDDKKLSEDEKDKIRAEAQDEILKSKKEIAAATSAAQKESLEARMKMMEELLAQKTENESKYQKLIEQLSKKTDELSKAEDQAVVAKAEKALRKPASNNFQASPDFDSFDNQANRSPSSYGDSSYGGTAGGTGGGSTGGSSGSSARVSPTTRGASRAAGNFNTALLEAQEAKTGKIQKSVDGSIVIASDAETPILKSMSNAATGTNDYSISVPASDYMGFESQNVETLKRYQEKLLSSMDSNQPVRMVVKSDKKEPLEFFVVKEGSKLFFKPVRKSGATLEALKMAVKKNP